MALQVALLDAQAEARGELDRPQDAHRVLAHAHVRVADGAQDAGLEVVDALDPVEDAPLERVEEQRVDREVAAARVLDRRAVLVVLDDQEVVVGAVSAARAGTLPSRPRGAVDHVHEPEAAAR
jgi:hypothetical protein